MAKDITLKTRNGETRYPKSVTDLIFENGTGKTLQTIITELRQVDSDTDIRTRMFKADVTNLDTLNKKTDIGLYNYVGNGWRGAVSINYDSADNVSQVALSSSTPSYNGNTLTWISAQPCAMARTYKNGAWSHWEKVGAPVVNDLTTGGTDKALSAEMGKTLKEGLAALGPKLGGVESALELNSNSVQISSTGTKGYISNVGEVVNYELSSYRYFEPIELKKGERIVCQLYGLTTMSVISIYSNNTYTPVHIGEAALKTYSYDADEDCYVVLCCSASYTPLTYTIVSIGNVVGITKVIESKADKEELDDVADKLKAAGITIDGLSGATDLSKEEVQFPSDLNSGYIRYRDSVVVESSSSSYRFTNPIHLEAGQLVVVDLYTISGAEAIAPVALYNGDGTYSVVSSLVAKDAVATYQYAASKDCYVVFSCNKNYLPTKYLVFSSTLKQNVNNTKTAVVGDYDKTRTLTITQGTRISEDAHITGLSIKEGDYVRVKVKTESGSILGYGIFANGYILQYGSASSENYTGEDVVFKATKDITSLGLTISEDNITESGSVTISVCSKYKDSLVGKSLLFDERDKEVSKLENVYDISNNPASSFVSFFDKQTLMQNYFDDMHDDLTQMLRTDKIVPNQGNIAIYGSDSVDTIDDVSVDTKANGNIKTVICTWHKAEPSLGEYDFSSIKDGIDAAVASGRRAILQVFASASYSGDGFYTTYTHNGTTKKIGCPSYIMQHIAEDDGQIVANGDWYLLDVNNTYAQQRYDALLSAFYDYISTTKVEGRNDLYLKDAILYIRFSLIGAYGEGGWQGLALTDSAVVRAFYQSAVTRIPDVMLATGIDTIGDGTIDYNKYNLYCDIKDLSNDCGYIGIFCDHIGSFSKVLFDNDKDSIFKAAVDKWVNRGDFFTGEFAMWNDTSGMGGKRGNCGLFAYYMFNRLKMPYVEAKNIAVYDRTNSLSRKIPMVSRYASYVVNSALSMVGFRIVVTPISISGSNVVFELNNIGLNRCYFDIYQLYLIVENTDNSEKTEVLINQDFTAISPANASPLQYGIGNGKNISVSVSNLPTNYRIYIIGKDKFEIQEPLYFSNYGRNSDGSYLLFES